MKSKNLTKHKGRSDRVNDHYLVSSEQYLSASLDSTKIDGKIISGGYMLDSYELSDDEKITYECDELYILTVPKNKKKEISLLSFDDYGSGIRGFSVMYTEDYKRIKNNFLSLDRIDGHLVFELYSPEEFVEQVFEKQITNNQRDTILEVFGDTYGFDFMRLMKQNIDGDVW